jgi:hypothetical protein
MRGRRHDVTDVTSASKGPSSVADEFLCGLALVSTAGTVLCLSLVALLVALRSGLGTSPSLVVLCAAVLVSTAYAPFLIPGSWRRRLTGAKFLYALLMVAVLFSPILCLWLPASAAYGYVVAGLLGVVRAAPYVARARWRALAAVVVAGAILGVHLMTAQGLQASAFLPELMTLGRFSGDHYLHAAIAGMIRYAGRSSTGLDGPVPFQYHVGSHYWFAAIGSITGTDSAQAYLVGRTVFMLPALCLALLVAAWCLRRSGAHDASLLVVTTSLVLVLIDGAKLDRYTYRSESEVFGIIVLLLALPLLDDAVARAECQWAIPWSRAASWPLIVLLAGCVKGSVGVLLAVVVCHALARTAKRSLAIVAIVSVAVAAAVPLSGVRGGLGEFLMIRPLGFLVSGFDLVALSIVFAGALTAAIVWPRLHRSPAGASAPSRWRPWPGRAGPLSWEELTLVMAGAAAAPVLVVAGFAGWYFVDAVLWFGLAIGLARCSRAGVLELWRTIRSLQCGPLAIGFGLAMGAAAFLRAFTPGDLVPVTREMLAGLDDEERRRLSSLGQRSPGEVFRASLAGHRVLFGPEFVAALRNSYGTRVVELIRRAAHEEGRSRLAVFVPPQNVKFWRYSVDCRSQPLFVPALAGVPMVRGLPPIGEGCPLPRMFGYADYGATSRTVEASHEALCEHARRQGILRVLVLRDVETAEANPVVRCGGTAG